MKIMLGIPIKWKYYSIYMSIVLIGKERDHYNEAIILHQIMNDY